jgi:hypothetical protein
MVELLSSKLTFMQKFIFPALWTLGFGSGTLTMFFGPMLDKRGLPVPPAIKFLFLIIFVIGTPLIIRLSGKIKKVSIDGVQLIVSNYLSEDRIAFSQISDVKVIRWQKGNPILVTFRRPSKFGAEIVFMPKVFLKFGPNPIAQRLRGLAGLKEDLT